MNWATGSPDADRARAATDAAIEAEQQADKQLSALRLDLVDVAGRLGEDYEPGDDPDEVLIGIADPADERSILVDHRAAPPTPGGPEQNDTCGRTDEHDTTRREAYR